MSEEQLDNYLKDDNRYAFKVVHIDDNKTIGHAEIYKLTDRHCKLCRILIGDKFYRGKGYGIQLTNALVAWAKEKIAAENIILNVYEFNLPAIKVYEKVGFTILNYNSNVIRYKDEYWNSYTMKYNGR